MVTYNLTSTSGTTATFTFATLTSPQIVKVYIQNRKLGGKTVKMVRIIVYRSDDAANNRTTFWAAYDSDTRIKSNRHEAHGGDLQPAFEAAINEVRDMIIMLDMMEVL